MEKGIPNTVQYKRFNVRKGRYLKSVMESYIKIIHISFEERRSDFDGNEFIEYDVLKKFLEYNGKGYISDDAPYFADTLHQFLDNCFNLYMNPEERSTIYNGGVVATIGVEESEDTGGNKYEFSIHSVMKALSSDDTIDENTNDSMKRVLMINDLHEDEDFLSAAIHFGKLNQLEVHKSIDEVLEIVKAKVFPKYVYLDYNDLKDIVLGLLREKAFSNGLFSEKKETLIEGRVNLQRSFRVSLNS